MKNSKVNTKCIWFFFVIAILSGSCKKETWPPDFGMEEGYFWWVDDDEKLWLKRDRNHLSIHFYEDYGKAFHDSILAEYGIQTVWAQTFDMHPPMPGYYRVTKKPAEEYYTNYGDTTLNRLGNLAQIEFVLPVFYKNEDFWDLKLMPKILYTFHDSITDARQGEILDSLIAYDNIELRQLFSGEEWSNYHIYVTKSSPACPYTLYHRYYETGFFKSMSLDYAFTSHWLKNK